MPLKYAAMLLLPLILGVRQASADPALLPGNAGQGNKLHATHCTGCHDAKLYTRNDRRVRSVGGLIKQVEVCNRQLQKQLSREQMNDLVAYLNETYYRFE